MIWPFIYYFKLNKLQYFLKYADLERHPALGPKGAGQTALHPTEWVVPCIYKKVGMIRVSHYLGLMCFFNFTVVVSRSESAHANDKHPWSNKGLLWQTIGCQVRESLFNYHFSDNINSLLSPTDRCLDFLQVWQLIYLLVIVL